jgi:hypothetical protein
LRSPRRLFSTFLLQVIFVNHTTQPYRVS